MDSTRKSVIMASGSDRSTSDGPSGGLGRLPATVTVTVGGHGDDLRVWVTATARLAACHASDSVTVSCPADSEPGAGPACHGVTVAH